MQTPGNKALTHSGKFHADDVFSTALLRILNPEIEIIRARSLPEDFDGLAFDIGGGAFDHHQKDAPVRENGIAYASFGLLWKEFGHFLLEGRDIEVFDRHFVQSLDLDDNTGCGDPIAELIGNFNPVWDSWDSQDSQENRFWQAVEFATVILQNRFTVVRASLRARELVFAALHEAQDGIVVLPCYAPWKFALYNTQAQFVIYPSQRGGFSAQAVPRDDENGVLKCPFPADWAGCEEQELARRSGIATLRFCHNNRFLIAAGEQDDAIAACRAAQQEKRKETAE